MSQKRFRPFSDLITRLKGGNHGGNGGCTNNLRTFPGLLAPFCWTDYGSGTGAGLIVRARYRVKVKNPKAPAVKGEAEEDWRR